MQGMGPAHVPLLPALPLCCCCCFFSCAPLVSVKVTGNNMLYLSAAPPCCTALAGSR
jgi:hypothetical protein